MWTSANEARFANSECMKPHSENREEGKVGWALLWLLGVPLPVLLIIYLLKGCH